jgi:hypothetical protein
MQMNETNKEVKKVLDYFYKAGHIIVNITKASDTKIWLDKSYIDSSGIIQGDHNDWTIKKEQTSHIKFTDKKNFLGLGFDTVCSVFSTNYFVIELESDKNKAYLVVSVKNGIHKVGKSITNKARVYDNKHSVIEVGFGRKDFVDTVGEYNVYNQKEWNDLTKYALNLEHRI